MGYYRVSGNTLLKKSYDHRVHHGSQEKYLDKNYGATFIIWDRLLGTYQPEEEAPVYGITTNIGNKANPIHINFHEFIDMVNDMRKARGLRQKLFYFYGSPIAVAQKKQQLAQLNDGSTDECIEQLVQYKGQH